jgi:hypothetical protein
MEMATMVDGDELVCLHQLEMLDPDPAEGLTLTSSARFSMLASGLSEELVARADVRF